MFLRVTKTLLQQGLCHLLPNGRFPARLNTLHHPVIGRNGIGGFALPGKDNRPVHLRNSRAFAAFRIIAAGHKIQGPVKARQGLCSRFGACRG